jgi:hypothetical protein
MSIPINEVKQVYLTGYKYTDRKQRKINHEPPEQIHRFTGFVRGVREVCGAFPKPRLVLGNVPITNKM